MDDMRISINAWATGPHAANCSVRWRFTTADARIKLISVYPQSEELG